MYVIIDNYDSFTYNVYQYLCGLTLSEVKVFRNDEITVQELMQMPLEGLIISPGPGDPNDAGISTQVIKEFAGKVKILGVCLGHQCIGQVFGGKIVRAKAVMHGKTDLVTHDNKGVFRSVMNPVTVVRYHSLVIEPESCPDDLEITALSSNKEIMGIRHKKFDIEGVQFHPESIGTEMGMKMLANFVKYRKESFIMKTILEKLEKRIDLTREEAASVMDELTDGNLTEAQIAAFLVCLNAKGIKAAEIAGCAGVLRNKKIHFEIDTDVTDTCGTGGDGMGTFNISSMTAIGLSALGLKIAKHGNRAVSSQTGCADFYQELGIPLNMTPAQSKILFDKTGFAFLFAPTYHSAMRHAGKVRKELGIKTIMNLLGPLANPADAAHQMIGVFSPEFLKPVAEAAIMLGVKNIMTVHSEDGQDEVSVNSKTSYYLMRDDGEEAEGTLDPKDFDLPVYSFDDVRGGDAKENAEMARSLMCNQGYEGLRDAVCLNMAAAQMISRKTKTMQEGFKAARDAFADGSVKKQFEKIIKEAAQIGAIA